MTKPVPADVISRIKAVLGEGGWSQDPDRLAPKLVEWRDRWSGTTPLLALPCTTAEVAARPTPIALRSACNPRRQPDSPTIKPNAAALITPVMMSERSTMVSISTQ